MYSWRNPFWLSFLTLLRVENTTADSGTCVCPDVIDASAWKALWESGLNVAKVNEELLKACATPSSSACVSPCICECKYGDIYPVVSGDATKWEHECRSQTATCVDPGPHNDPHMMGLLGQTFDWAGTDGEWYSMLSDGPDLQMNVRVTAPLPEFPDRQLLTAVSLVLDGGQHSLVVEVQDPHSMETDQGCSIPAEGGLGNVLPCLANGALRILVDGQDYVALVAPVVGELLPDGRTVVSATNLPAECQPFGGDKLWAANVENIQSTDHRNLRAKQAEISLEDWVLRSGTLAAPEWCAKFLAEEGIDGLLNVHSAHTVFRIDAPMVSLRINVGINHQDSQVLPDGRVVPELKFWQANVGVERSDVSPGLGGMLGETSRIVVDKNGKPIMHGLEVLGGSVESYRVSGPLGVDFEQLHGGTV